MKKQLTREMILQTFEAMRKNIETVMKLTFKNDGYDGLPHLETMARLKKIKLNAIDLRFIEAVQMHGNWGDDTSRTITVEVTEKLLEQEFIAVMLPYLEKVSFARFREHGKEDD